MIFLKLLKERLENLREEAQAMKRSTVRGLMSAPRFFRFSKSLLSKKSFEQFSRLILPSSGTSPPKSR